ncbi:MAG: LPS export ABC transporter periplasmic protein LptC [Synergistaceae bacterium]|nr:LPS export ABC transporter periplasmic protein LptC [Synergistaceae bacterium]
MMSCKTTILLVGLFLFFSFTSRVNAEAGSLSADNISYNVNTKKAQAKGNVVVKKKNATMWGDTAEGNTETSEFSIKGNVKGDFPENKAKITADSAKWTKGLEKDNNVVEAFGKVLLTREPKDKLNADYVRWETEKINYLARGKVDGVFENKIIKAAEAGRTEDKFWGRKVIRYEDTVQKIGFSGEVLDGTITNNEIQTAVAVGSVSIDYVDKDGLKSVVTGEKAVYSKAKATVVVTGKAHMVRSDGKTADADKFILHEDTKNIEAIGNSTMIFDAADKNNKETSKMKKSGK